MSEKLSHVSKNQKRAGVTILIFNKIYLKGFQIPKKWWNDKRANSPGWLIFTNMYVPNFRAPKYMKKIFVVLKRELTAQQE